ncbi:unnamed protein product [Brassica oleracea]
MMHFDKHPRHDVDKSLFLARTFVWKNEEITEEAFVFLFELLFCLLLSIVS